MELSVNIEKMPKVVQDAYGTAQKQLTLIEGEARKYITDTYGKFVKNSSVKRVIKLQKEFSDLAADTIGVATKADIKSVTRKLNKLKSEVRRLTGKK